MEYIILIILIINFIVGILIGIILEKNNFNNGVCPHCNRKLINFDMDSQCGRGYKCDCGYQTWVSYKCVDKNFYLNS